MTAATTRPSGPSNGREAGKDNAGHANSKRAMKAPDGGWGWMVILGASLVSLTTRSLDASFGLLFGDVLRSLNVGTTGAAVIVSTQDTIVNFSGLFAGPLIRKFSYRMVTLIGVALVATGILSTIAASSVAHIIATYSVIVGLGAGISSAATFVAVSNYWVTRRGQAIGLSMAGTGLGFMFYPLLVRLLLDELGFQGALLVLGGIVLHGLVGAALLQPVEWHRIPADEPKDKEVPPHEGNRESQQPLLTRPRIDITLAEEDEVSSAEEAVPMKRKDFQARNTSLNPRPELKRAVSSPGPTSDADEQTPLSSARRFSRTNIPRNLSLVSMGAGEISEKRRHSGGIIARKSARVRQISVISGGSLDLTESLVGIAAVSDQDIRTTDGVTASAVPIVIHEPLKPTFWGRITKFLDLDLLRDRRYGVMTLGLVLFWVAELHFRMVVPFFLMDLGISKADVAFCLSVTAVADILARLVLPPLFDRFKYTKRSLFFVACVFLGISRSVFAEQTQWAPMLTSQVIAGFCRGATLINYRLTVAESVPLERLAGAIGLNMVAKGLAVVVLGPALGLIRDATGSFALFIHAQTALMALGLLLWVIEWIVIRLRTRRSKVHEPVDHVAELSV